MYFLFIYYCHIFAFSIGVCTLLQYKEIFRANWLILNIDINSHDNEKKNWNQTKEFANDIIMIYKDIFPAIIES
jgi:hypothetical protein